MFDLLHLRDEIGFLDQRVFGTAAGDHHMLHGRSAPENRQYILESDIVELEGNIEFIENDYRIGRIEQEPTDRSPGLLGELRIPLTILGLPGVPFAHTEKGDPIAIRLECPFLCRIDRALDELHHSDLHAMAETS